MFFVFVFTCILISLSLEFLSYSALCERSALLYSWSVLFLLLFPFPFSVFPFPFSLPFPSLPFHRWGRYEKAWSLFYTHLKFSILSRSTLNGDWNSSKYLTKITRLSGYLLVLNALEISVVFHKAWSVSTNFDGLCSSCSASLINNVTCL